MKQFDIVIVNWNSGTQLKECIESVNRATQTNCVLDNIIVVDNESTDNSIELLNAKQENLIIIRNDENLGFGKACNQGAKDSKSDFILFLNPDMLVFEDTFLKLFEYIEKNDSSDIGVYGIQLFDDQNNIQRSCARFPNLWNFIIKSIGLNKINNKVFKSYHLDEWAHDETKFIDHVIGAFYLIKKDIFTSLNGFDEKFFVYMEDLDFSKRVQNNGFKSIYLTEAKAYHKGGGTSEQVKAKRLFYSTRSRLIYAFKHFGVFQGLVLMLFTFLVEPFTRTLFLVLKGNYRDVFEGLKGFFLLYKDTLNILKLGTNIE